MKKFRPCEKAKADCQHCSSCWVAITWVIKGINAKEVSAFPRKQKFPLCGWNLSFHLSKAVVKCGISVKWFSTCTKQLAAKINRWPFYLESDVYTNNGENQHPSKTINSSYVMTVNDKPLIWLAMKMYQIISTRRSQKERQEDHFKFKDVLKGCAKCIIYFISIHECEF